MLSAENQRSRSSTSQPFGPRTLGKYELIARIGKGGMAEVYLARQRGPMNFEKVVVVKTIHPHLAAQKEFIDMLLDEARIAALLKHPCVVDIYDLGMDGETYFIAMEYLSGQPLLSVLRAGRQKKQPLPIHSTCRVISDVADGLHAAHELKDSSGRQLDLVHRDITPGNIIVLYNGQVKIVDFGIAKARGRMAMETNARQLKGKLGYVAPEQIRNQPVDRRADIFALGVVMWEALTYRRLFRGNDPSSVLTEILKKSVAPPSAHRPEVPSELDEICMRALARNPEERYSAASELHADLEQFLARSGTSLQKRAIADYMGELFTSDIAEHERLLRETAKARSMIDAMSRRPGSFAEESSSGDLPAGMTRAPSEAGDALQPGAYPRAGSVAPAGLDAQLPVGPGAPRGPASAPDLRQSAELALSRSSDPALQRPSYPALPPPSDPALQRPSYPALSRPSDPSLGSIVLPVTGTALAAEAGRLRKRRWLIGGGVGAALVVLLALGMLSEEPKAQEPAATASPEVARAAVAGRPGGGLQAPAVAPRRQGERQDTAPAEPARDPAAAPGQPAVAAEQEGSGQTPALQAGAPARVPGAGPDHEPGNGDEVPEASAPKPTQSLPGRRSSTESGARLKNDAAARQEADELYKQGLALFVRGDTAEALRKFQTAVRILPDHAQAYRGLGMVYERTGQKQKAAEAFRKYLRLAPDARDQDSIRKRLSELEG